MERTEEIKFKDADKTLFFYMQQLAQIDASINDKPDQVIISLLSDLKLYCAQNDIDWQSILSALSLVDYVNKTYDETEV